MSNNHDKHQNYPSTTRNLALYSRPGLIHVICWWLEWKCIWYLDSVKVLAPQSRTADTPLNRTHPPRYDDLSFVGVSPKITILYPHRQHEFIVKSTPNGRKAGICICVNVLRTILTIPCYRGTVHDLSQGFLKIVTYNSQSDGIQRTRRYVIFSWVSVALAYLDKIPNCTSNSRILILKYQISQTCRRNSPCYNITNLRKNSPCL